MVVYVFCNPKMGKVVGTSECLKIIYLAVNIQKVDYICCNHKYDMDNIERIPIPILEWYSTLSQ